MTCNNVKEMDTIRIQMIEIAWKIVSINEELNNNLWKLFEEEFIDKINTKKEEDIPF